MRIGKLSICALICAIVMMFCTSALAAPVVKEGTAGEHVTKVQTLLKEKGFYFGEVTGECDSITVEAKSNVGVFSPVGQINGQPARNPSRTTLGGP